MKKIILDTDMGPDCDDAGALAILNHFVEEGRIELLGVTHDTADINGTVTIDAINSWFGHASIPVGHCGREGFMCDDTLYGKYVSKTAAAYLQGNKAPEYPDAVWLLRKLLAENEAVTLIGVGPLNNIADLLRSGPDDVSEKTGLELIREHVAQVALMGGDFERNHVAEFNIECDVESAQYVARNCPVPVIYCGYETGTDVITGGSLAEEPDAYPVKNAYYLWNGQKQYGRSSWDLVTVYVAVMGCGTLWELSKPSTIRFNDKSCTIVDGPGKDYYLRAIADEKTIANTLEPYLSSKIQRKIRPRP